MRPLYKKDTPPDLTKSQDQENYILEAHNSAALLQKEMDVNLAEQELLRQRIQMMSGLINDLSEKDPKYFFLTTQTKMDQIELDELKNREAIIFDRLK